MFKRRNKLSIGSHLREWFWPRAGWRRLVLYYRHRLVRLPDTPYRVAAGVACGVAISFTPFLGLHVLLALALAFVVRGNLVAAAIGTIVGNPWTFPLIWALTYSLGAFLLGMDAAVGLQELVDGERLLIEPMETLRPVLPPMIAGSIPIALVVWFGVYWPLDRLIHRYQARRVRRLERRNPPRRDTESTSEGEGGE